MDSKERLVSQTLHQTADHVPTIGGWILGARNLSRIANCSLEQYLQAPFEGVIRAHQNLNVDGVVSWVITTEADQIRAGLVEEAKFEGIEPEALLDAAERIPDSEEKILAGFCAEAEAARYRSHFANALESWGGIVHLPNFWEIGGHFPLYTQYGYTAFLSACALYPEAVRRIWWAKSIRSRERAKVLVEIYKEMGLVPTMFCGEDLCSMQGPMCSLDFLRKQYFPTVAMIIEPLVESGVRLIHHCDGDIRPIVNDILRLGFRGFQGFQYECGVSIRELRSMRTLFDEQPLIWAGMSVSRSLPFGSEDDVRAEIDGFYRDTDGGHGLFVFTSNVSGVDVPAENLVAGYQHARQLKIR